MLVHKCKFLLQLLLKIYAYFSRISCNKTCPSYEFLVVFGQVRVWDWKSAGAGLKCTGAGRERARFLKLMRVRGGSGQKFQPEQDSTQNA